MEIPESLSNYKLVISQDRLSLMYAYDTKSLVHIVVRRYTHSITLYYSEQVRTLILRTDYGSSAFKVAFLSLH